MNALADLRDFLELGGAVLWLLFALSFLLCWFASRLWLSLFTTPAMPAINHTPIESRMRLDILRLLTRLAPLFGLLGTITGMMDVFALIAINGSSQARLLADGIARATLPTMAGMVVAVFGLLLVVYFERALKKRA